MKRYSLELNGKHIKEASRKSTLIPLAEKYASEDNLVTIWDMETGEYQEF